MSWKYLREIAKGPAPEEDSARNKRGGLVPATSKWHSPGSDTTKRHPRPADDLGGKIRTNAKREKRKKKYTPGEERRNAQALNRRPPREK